MDLTVEEFIDGLFSKEATETPSDTVKPADICISLPKDFDEKKYKSGREFYWSHCAVFSSTMLLGLVTILAVPSILKVLIGTHRSTSVFTAYRRYASTFIHTLSWFEHDLKPGSISWISLETVRSRHLRAGLAGKLKGYGHVSQRDLALTQFGFVGYSMLYPDKFNIYQLKSGDWEAYNYCWSVIGHMIGIEDRYNICRRTVAETREVCEILQRKVFTPCLDQEPEYYQHMARTLLDGLDLVVDANAESVMFVCKNLSKVPGYIYTEQERIDLIKNLTAAVEGKPLHTGVDSTQLLEKCPFQLPERATRLLFLQDYETVVDSPAYKQISFKNKLRLNINMMILKFNSTYIGRFLLNLHFKINLFFMKNFPVWGYIKYGIKDGFINIFSEDPVDVVQPKLNSEFYKNL